MEIVERLRNRINSDSKTAGELPENVVNFASAGSRKKRQIIEGMHLSSRERFAAETIASERTAVIRASDDAALRLALLQTHHTQDEILEIMATRDEIVSLVSRDPAPKPPTKIKPGA